MTLAVLFGLFALLVIIEVPVAFAMGLASIATITLTQPIPLSIVVQRMGTGLDSFVLIAIPLFVLAGHLLNRAGIADRIFEFAAALVGHVRGGLAHVNVVASMIFAGMSGVAQADAAGLGVVEVNAMRKEGFDVSFAAAVSAASAIIGPIIPPSVIMVVYAVMVQVSVADLFLAGILPGILMGGALMVMIYWLVSTGRSGATDQRMSYPRLGRTFVRALPALAAPILLTVGLLAGVATPTGAGRAHRRVCRGARLHPARADVEGRGRACQGRRRHRRRVRPRWLRLPRSRRRDRRRRPQRRFGFLMAYQQASNQGPATGETDSSSLHKHRVITINRVAKVVKGGRRSRSRRSWSSVTATAASASGTARPRRCRWRSRRAPKRPSATCSTCRSPARRSPTRSPARPVAVAC